jgi:putative FmdB family regulatory protein
LPRYDYQCQTCNHRFEVKQGFSSEPVAQCPECDNASERVISSVPVVFKGSGWYVNDYGKGKSSSNSTPESKPSDSDGSNKNTAKKNETASSPNNESTSKTKSKKQPTSAS